MKSAILGVAIIALSLVGTEARKFKDEETNRALKNTRRVQQSYGSGSSRQIYWDFGQHYWRLDMRPPALEVGWEFEQTQPIYHK